MTSHSVKDSSLRSQCSGVSEITHVYRFGPTIKVSFSTGFSVSFCP